MLRGAQLFEAVLVLNKRMSSTSTFTGTTSRGGARMTSFAEEVASRHRVKVYLTQYECRRLHRTGVPAAELQVALRTGEDHLEPIRKPFSAAAVRLQRGYSAIPIRHETNINDTSNCSDDAGVA